MFFAFFSISIAIAQNTTGVTTATTMAAAGKNGSLAPHIRPWAPRRRIKWMGDNPPSLRMYFGGGMRVYMALKALLCSGDDELPQHWSVWGPYTPATAPKILSICSGGCRPSIRSIGLECKASCGALEGHFHWRRPWSAMVVLVVVGLWRLTSVLPTVGIVKIVYRNIFFHFYVDPIYSWHLTHRLNKEDLDLCTWNISWFLCPVFYSR